MKAIELNKTIASILVAALIAIIAGTIANILYKPQVATKRGYEVVVTDTAPAAGGAAKIDFATLMKTADAKAGEIFAKKCMSCHSFGKGEAAKVGPNLWAIVGAKHAHSAGFAYSDGMKNAPGSWDEASLNQFLTKPSAYIAGTKMSFAGIGDDKDRANVIAFLKTLK